MMNNRTIESTSPDSGRRRCSIPFAEAWLPDMGDDSDRVSRKRWRELNPSERRKWLAKMGLLMALALALVLHPSSGFKDVVVRFSFLFILFRRRKLLFSRKPDQLSLAIMVYGLIVAASVAYSAHRHWSVRDALKFCDVLAMVFVAWHLLKSRAFFFGLLQLLVGALLLVSIYDVVTYLGGLGRLWEWGERWVFGPYNGHPNTASAVIMVVLPISAFLFIVTRNVWLKGMHACFIGLGLFLMYVMASRTAQVSLAGMMLCGAFLVRPRKKKMIAGAIVVCVLVLGYLNIRALNPRFLDETAKTLTFRDENWRNVGKLIAKRPAFGYGFGKRNYQTVYHRTFRGSLIPYQHAHSFVLQTTFETGAIGLAAIVWMWLVTVYRLLKAYALHRNRRGGLMGALLLSVVGMSIYCLAEVPDGFLRSLFWLVIAMVGALAAKAPENSYASAEPVGEMKS
ncbi:O-antigen ligase family protein [bacterium]|nr:O-antigen ligase family protein [bacterium]